MAIAQTKTFPSTCNIPILGSNQLAIISKNLGQICDPNSVTELESSAWILALNVSF